MRKVKNNIRTSNPAVMFAAGIESIIRDPMFNPSQNDYHEQQRIQRTASRQDSRGNLFGALLRQFANF